MRVVRIEPDIRLQPAAAGAIRAVAAEVETIGGL